MIDYKETIAEFVVEEYRFIKSYSSAVNKLFVEERQKYISTYNFHISKINEIAAKAKIGIVLFDGKEYDEGLPIKPLNLDEFKKDDVLIIQQTIEPTIIDTEKGKTIKIGSVILSKKISTENNEIVENQTQGEKK